MTWKKNIPRYILSSKMKHFSRSKLTAKEFLRKKNTKKEITKTMSLNSTPSADRVHIGIFGRRNAGKSSIINAITGQNLAIVSDVLGTTTDPVPKAMELLPLGPVVIIDTPGLDDTGELGQLRVKKAYQILNKTDIAVLVIDASLGMTPEDLSILKKIQDKKIPYVVVNNNPISALLLKMAQSVRTRIRYRILLFI